MAIMVTAIMVKGNGWANDDWLFVLVCEACEQCLMVMVNGNG